MGRRTVSVWLQLKIAKAVARVVRTGELEGFEWCASRLGGHDAKKRKDRIAHGVTDRLHQTADGASRSVVSGRYQTRIARCLCACLVPARRVGRESVWWAWDHHYHVKELMYQRSPAR